MAADQKIGCRILFDAKKMLYNGRMLSIFGRRKEKRLREKTGNKLYKLLPAALGISLLAVPLQSFAAPTYNAPLSVPFGGYDAWSEDVNGDGHDDLIASQSGAIAVALGNGDGTFGSPRYVNVVSSARGIAFADFDGDRDLDLATANWSTDQVTVLINDGTGSFTASAPFAVADQPQELAAGDVDGDGNADLFVGHSSGQALLLFGNGAGGFEDEFDFSGNQPRSVTIADLNKDGKLDLVQLNHFDDSVYVRLNKGGRHDFEAPIDFPAGNQGLGLVAADLNLDDKLDLAYVSNGGGTADVLIGNGDGTFAPRQTNTIGGNPSDVEVADFNGDGILDLAGSVSIPHVGFFVFIFIGKGDGTFEEATRYDGFSNSGMLTSGDFNEDGIDDLVIISGSEAKIFYARSEGTLSFGSPTYAAEESDTSVTVAVYRTAGDFGRAEARFRTIDGTAKAGTDYVAVDDKIVFKHGQTIATYTISLIDNGDYAGDRTFAVELSDPVNGTVIGAVYSSTVTIAENDEAPDVVAPSIDVSKFSAIDRHNGTADELEGAAGAVSEAGAIVRAYRWTDGANAGVIDAGELGDAIVLGVSAADGAVAASPLGDLGPGTYAFVVTATDSAGNESEKDADAAVAFSLLLGDEPIVTPPDTTSPVWAGGSALAIAGITTNAASLSWPAAMDDVGVAGYRVYRDGTLVATEPASSRGYSATGLASGTAYAFAVTAVDAAGNESAALTASATTARASSGGGASAPSRSSDGSLASLSFVAGGAALKLTPEFRPDVYKYKATTSADRVAFDFSTSHSGATVFVNDKVADGETVVLLQEGENVIRVTVRAEDGTEIVYQFDVYREYVTQFADAAGHWAAVDIGKAYALGIVYGYADGSFRPNVFVSRTEWLAMLGRSLKWPSVPSASLPFADKADVPAWARSFVAEAASRGIVSGYVDGSFRAERPVTLAEATAMLVRAMGWSFETSAAASFAEDGDVPAWVKPYAAAGKEHGILLGRNDGRFDPFAELTRAEAVSLLIRLIEQKS